MKRDGREREGDQQLLHQTVTSRPFSMLRGNRLQSGSTTLSGRKTREYYDEINGKESGTGLLHLC
jgi:hypothetical protein